VDLDGTSSFEETPLNGVGVLLPQTDTAAADVNGSWAFGAQDFNGLCGGCFEFDFVGEGTIANRDFSGTGLISDPFMLFGDSTTETGVSFAGPLPLPSTVPLVPDESNPGRYTISFPDYMTIDSLAVDGTTQEFDVTVYQASSGQLLWIEVDPESGWGGTLQALVP